MAGLLLYKLIIEACQKFGCVDDCDYPRIILYSYPFSKMISLKDAKENSSDLGFQLRDVICNLQQNGAEVIGIACNTLYSFITLPTKELINMIQETIDYVLSKKLSRVMVLATPTTIENRLYERGIEIDYPCGYDQKTINKIIDRILKGEVLKEDAEDIRYIARGYDGFILGCSELSILNDKYPIENAIDPLRILASCLCR